MYSIPHFIENDLEVIASFMNKHPFVMLVGSNLSATQIPVLIYKEGASIFIKGHYMKGTDHAVNFAANPNVLVVFQGPQCYVSASWYSERGHGSTWNYMTVQAKAILQFYDDRQTSHFLKELTHFYEDQQTQPELMENMTEGYIESSLAAIVGFEAQLTDIRATFKLSQNRDDESYMKIITALEATHLPQEKSIADEMKQRRPHLFTNKCSI